MPKFRFPQPVHLPGITEFTDQPELNDPLLVIEIAKAIGVWDELLKATRRERKGPTGPDPEFPDAWIAAKFAHVLDGRAVEKWFESPYYRQRAFWKDIGMPRRPSRSLVYQVFDDLEDHEPAVQDAAAKVIAHCRTFEPRIGTYWHFDGREAEAHMVLEEVDIKALDEEDRAELEREDKNGDDRRPTRLRKLSSQEARQVRSDAADKLELDEEGRLPKRVVPAHGQWWAIEGGDVNLVQIKTDDKGRTRVKVGKKWYWTRDPEARLRVYTGKDGRVTRVWVGYYHMAVIDHFTGATLANLVRSAGVQEAHLYPEAFAKAQHTLGFLPLAAAGDKGLYTRDVIAHNTELDVASVMPPRANSAGVSRDRVDAHGVGRCAYCGGPGHFIRFKKRTKNNAPRLMFRCAKPRRDECRGREQSLTYDYDPLRVQPLARTNLIWHELSKHQHNIEHAHDDRDTRYGVGGANSRTRMKKLGVAPQQLQATVAVLVEWLRIAWRMGWLDEQTKTRIRTKFELRLKQFAGTLKTYAKKAKAAADRVAADRFATGLDDPYGTAAAKHNYGPAKPPKYVRATDTFTPGDPDPPPDDGDDGLSAIEMLTT